jgi:hypothetical protein
MAMQQLKGSSKQMGDLVERLRHEGVDAFQQKYSLGMFKLCGEAADRIEALEKLYAESRQELMKWIRNDPADAEIERLHARIEALEADVDRFVGQRDKALKFIRANADRIEVLEAALRSIASKMPDDFTLAQEMAMEARAALAFATRFRPHRDVAALAPEKDK